MLKEHNLISLGILQRILMSDLVLQQSIKDEFAKDSFAWFKGERHGHMEKWQYLEPEYENDPVQASLLWDRWENSVGDDNMLARQGQIIRDQAQDIAALTAPRRSLIDLGPGGINAVDRNTVPLIEAYKTIQSYTAIDIAQEAADNACSRITKLFNMRTLPLYGDFLDLHRIEERGHCVALIMGGTIGNIEAEQNTSQAIELMAQRITNLRQVLPAGTVLLIGLEATQDSKLLYGDYDYPAHAEFEINIMHGIKRDVLADQDGFDPYAWKYAMKWWPQAYQFCHLAEATEDQNFKMYGKMLHIKKGQQLVIDNSFKFPVLAMQRSAQLAKTEYLKPFLDVDKRMVVHALKLS